MTTRALRGATWVAAYTALAVAQTWPLVLHLDSHLPGRDLGDNATFLWNLWWMREAVASPSATFFHTDALFAPLGVPLVLHTHTALNAYLGASVLGPLGLVRAQNLLLLASLVLNGVSGYALARVVGSRTIPSAIAGGLLLISPVVATRLMGHYNLVAIWPVALGCAMVVWWRQHPAAPRAVPIGVAAGMLTYIDYYLTVYFLLFAIAYLLVHHGRATLHRSPRQSRTSTVALLMALLAFAAAAAIGVSSRDSIAIGSAVISLRSPTNALTVGWLLLVIGLLMRSSWTLDVGVTGAPGLRTYRALLLAAGVAAALVAIPVAVAAWNLWRDGGYVTVSSAIRSGPQGLDIGTLLMGPPFNGVVGERVRAGYGRLGIDPMESSAWAGWGAVLLAMFAWRRRSHDRAAGRWALLAAAFSLWALGPFLMAFGQNTGLLLPQALARLVPMVNNARIPGRALLVVAICLSVLAAMAIDRLHATGRWRLAVSLVVLAFIESLAAPLPLVALPPPGVYRTVAADATRAAVLPVPLGLRDGFGESGLLQHDVLYAQTLHRHPVAGGFIARLPPMVRQWYQSTQPFAALLALSEGQTTAWPSCAEAAAGLRLANIKYVVVYPASATAHLRQFVADVLPLRQIEQDDQRQLFEVTDACPGTLK